jgi:hypothetical protein
VKEVFFFCVALVYQNQPHSFSALAEIVDDIMAASFAVRQSKTILARILRSFEIAFVLVRFDHVARFIVNPDHSIM